MQSSHLVFLHTANPELRAATAEAIESAGAVLAAAHDAPPAATALLVLDAALSPAQIATLTSSAQGRDGVVPVLFVSA